MVTLILVERLRIKDAGPLRAPQVQEFRRKTAQVSSMTERIQSWKSRQASSSEMWAGMAW
jgi:hypothetical protein